MAYEIPEPMDRVRAALEIFREEGDECEDDQLVNSLLADLMKFCKLNDIKFQKCLTMAEIHYESEKGGG